MVQIYNFFEYHWTLIVILSDKLWLVLPYTQSDENVLFIFMVPDDRALAISLPVGDWNKRR